MPSRLAISRAWGLARTLKPKIMALDAFARVTSDSLMAPTELWSTRTFTSVLVLVRRSRAPLIASIEPCTSPLMTIGSSLASPAWMRVNICSRVPRDPAADAASRFLR